MRAGRLTDLTACDREPIHIPGSIQPHGLMLVVEAQSGLVRRVAGDIEGRLGILRWLDAPLADLVGRPYAQKALDGREGFVGRFETLRGEVLDILCHRSGAWLIIEMEPAPRETRTGVELIAPIEQAGGAFERAVGLKALFETAAVEFRQLTGFDRVMIYRFLDDEAGVVVGEDIADGQQSFMNHHFPGSDIPRQARALYLRNLVRVIPDTGYSPASLRPAADEPLDLSDSVLRSVSPIHLQYMRNMGVGASASVSIVKDGVLWGLVACHNTEPRTLSYETRVACRTLAGGLARQIKAKDDADSFRERVRLRSFEDDIVELLSREGSLDRALSNHIDEVRRMFTGDGVAVLREGELVCKGACPTSEQIRDLAAWVVKAGGETAYATNRLAEDYPAAEAFKARASGLLALTLSASEPWVLLWFRAEQVEVVKWAGNPHKDQTNPEAVLTPRASFDAWRDTVTGRSRAWSLAEIEAAGRLRTAVIEVRQKQRILELNRRLTQTLGEKETLLQQKQFLIGEVNHRVQNSLQLVGSFLALQSRASGNPDLVSALDEAQRRLNAVALVHRRLYRSDEIEVVDAARYVEDLVHDTVKAIGEDWRPHIVLELHPVMVPTDRAVTLGLVMTELLINANKYAYRGAPGPVTIQLLAPTASRFSLVVADKGVGRATEKQGFGSRMMSALVGQLSGDLAYEDNKPGVRAVVTAPIGALGSTSQA